MTFSNREKIMGVIVLITVLLMIWSFFVHKYEQAELIFPDDLEQDDPIETRTQDEVANDVIIDIKGSVQFPGVYKMSEGDRVIDAIEKAGGLTAHADEN